jgi:hypothetical protein
MLRDLGHRIFKMLHPLEAARIEETPKTEFTRILLALLALRGWLALLLTPFVIRLQLCFVAEALLALFAGYCTIAQFSVLESVFHKERAMIYV